MCGAQCWRRYELFLLWRCTFGLTSAEFTPLRSFIP
jgi:hypothetical protein